MKDNTLVYKIDKKIQKTLKQILKNQNEIFQLFFVAVWFFCLIYWCLWVYNTLWIFQIFTWFALVWAGLIILSHKTQWEKKPKITLFFEKYIWDILYLSFLLFVVLFIYSFFSGSSLSLEIWFYSIMSIYIYAKFLDHSVMNTLLKTQEENIDFLQIVIIFSSIVFVSLHYILEQFDIPDEKYFLTAGITLCFISVFTFVFSNIWAHWKNVVSKEKIHSHVLGNTYNYLLICTIILCFWIIGWQQFGNNNNFVEEESVFVQQFEEKPADIIEEPIEEFMEESEITATVFVEARVEELYTFNNQLQVGNSGEDVRKLQEFMAQKQYYFWELNGEFDEATRIWLRNTLIGECQWPDSTRGILWPQATLCINNIVVTYEQEIVSEEDPITPLEQDFE